MTKTKELVMLREGKFAETPAGPVVALAKGDTHPFPLEMAEYLLEAGAARVFVACPDFEGMKPGEVKKYVFGTFGVTLDARSAGLVQKAIDVFEAVTKSKYERPVKPDTAEDDGTEDNEPADADDSGDGEPKGSEK